MVNNEIIVAAFEGLVKEKQIKFHPTTGLYSFTVYLCEHIIDIHYSYLDSYYKIQIEYQKNNAQNETLFLTQSKKFHKKIRKWLRENKKSKKSFLNHMNGFVAILRAFLDNHKSLESMIEDYVIDLKFDGVFI